MKLVHHELRLMFHSILNIIFYFMPSSFKTPIIIITPPSSIIMLAYWRIENYAILNIQLHVIHQNDLTSSLLHHTYALIDLIVHLIMESFNERAP